jgi:hypothetical protein
MTFVAKHIAVSIGRPAGPVYAFVSDAANLPQWAAGLSGSIAKVGGSGCELLFTLFKRPEVSQAAFDHDAASVERDLKALKALMET